MEELNLKMIIAVLKRNAYRIDVSGHDRAAYLHQAALLEAQEGGEGAGAETWRKAYEPDEYEEAFKPARHPGFGIACTVAWTELHQAMQADGLVVPEKCGPKTRAWIVELVERECGRPPPPAQDSPTEAVAWELEGISGAKKLTYVSQDSLNSHILKARPLVYGDTHPAATPKAEAGDRFFVEHGVVHDRLTGKHLGPNHPDCSAEELLDVLKHLQNDACAWRMTAKAFDTPSKSEAKAAIFYRNELDSLVRSICSTPYFPDDWACMDCVIRARAALSQPKPTHRELRTAEEIQAAFDAGERVEYERNAEWEPIAVLLPRGNIEMLLKLGRYRAVVGDGRGNGNG